MTAASQAAMARLRSPEFFEWYLVPLLAFVIFVYASEVEKRHWHSILAGLLFALAEFTWEILNALLLYLTQYAPLWSTPGDSAYVILVGLNIEIYMMFCVAGVVLFKLLPADRNLRICGIPNRWLIPVLLGVFCMFVEVLLNQWDALAWDWPFWNWPNCYLLFFGYTLPFLGITWVYDKLSLRAKAVALALWLAVDVLCWIVFVNLLHWI